MVNQIRQSADQKFARSAFLAATIMFACVLGASSTAAAQAIATPKTPTIITPPEGAKAFLVGHAIGTQGYVCLPTSAGASTASWTVNSARPEATLFASFFGHDVQIITHFASPDAKPNKFAPSPLPGGGNATWQSSFDSSRVWAAVLHANILPASSDESSCPNTGSIPCLLLQSIGNDKGATGGSLFADTTFVQRLNTNGGAAPADGCAVSTDVGKQKLVPYTADYFFFRGGVSLE
jgi:hypothetical protein